MRQLPELFDVGVKERSLAYLFVAAALLWVPTLRLPHSEDLQDARLYRSPPSRSRWRRWSTCRPSG